MSDIDKKIEVAASELVRLIIKKLQDENTDVIYRTSLFITYNLFSHESDFIVVYNTLGGDLEWLEIIAMIIQMMTL